MACAGARREPTPAYSPLKDRSGRVIPQKAMTVSSLERVRSERESRMRTKMRFWGGWGWPQAEATGSYREKRDYVVDKIRAPFGHSSVNLVLQKLSRARLKQTSIM